MSYTLTDIWDSFLLSIQEPMTWVVLGAGLFLAWLLASLLGKSRIKGGNEPVRAARTALVTAAIAITAVTGIALVAASLWVPGHILVLVLLLLVPLILALALGRPLEVEQ